MDAINAYKEDGKRALKHMWYVLLVFTVINFIVTIAAGYANSETKEGYKSATFGAVWTMFLVIYFTVMSGRMVFAGQADPLTIGFLIGTSAMLCQLSFVLCCIFLTLGNETEGIDPQAEEADKAYGAFAFLNMIIYLTWTVLLTIHRKSVVVDTTGKTFTRESEDTVNPAFTGKSGAVRIDGYAGTDTLDDEENI